MINPRYDEVIYREYHTYQFPVLSGKTDVVDEIYRNLCYEYLDFEYDSTSPNDSWYDKIYPDIERQNMPFLSFLDFSIYSFNDRFIDFLFIGEGCGSYCTSFQNHEIFDLTNGGKVVIDSLLTHVGVTHIVERLNKTREIKIKEMIANIKKAMVTDKADERPYDDQLELYDGCLNSPYRTIETLEYYDFYFADSILYINIGKCAPHVVQAIDDLGDITVSIPFSEIKDYLSPYGRYITGIDE